MPKTLQDFKDSLAKDIYGITVTETIARGLCIDCKLPPKFHSEPGRKEYYISGLCEPCFDMLTKEPEE